MEYDGVTVRDHGPGPLRGWPGWEVVENDRGGLTLLSPRTSAAELGHRDDSERDIGEIIRACDAAEQGV